MKRAIVWDEVSPINGIPAEEVLANRDDLRHARGDIFIVVDDYDQVLEIQLGKIIASAYEMNPGLSLQEIADEYMIRKQQEEEAEIEERITSEQLQEEIAILSYDVMLMQEPMPATTFSTRAKSPRFKMIKRWFKKGFWSVDMLDDAVVSGWITAEEKLEITGE